MTQQELNEEVHRRPFRPFRIVLTTGEAYDVHHPDLIMVGNLSLVIGLTNDPQGTAFDRIVRADLFHVVRTEELPTTVPPTGNGQGQQS